PDQINPFPPDLVAPLSQPDQWLELLDHWDRQGLPIDDWDKAMPHFPPPVKRAYLKAKADLDQAKANVREMVKHPPRYHWGRLVDLQAPPLEAPPEAAPDVPPGSTPPPS